MSDDKPTKFLRRTRPAKYTQVDNDLLGSLAQHGLKWGDAGLLVYLISKPDNWTVRPAHLVNQAADGRAAVKAILSRLRAAGFMRCYAERDDLGRVSCWVWEYADHPAFEPNGPLAPARPEVDSPQVDFPLVENRPLSNDGGVATTEVEQPPPTPRKRGGRANPQQGQLIPSPASNPEPTTAGADAPAERAKPDRALGLIRAARERAKAAGRVPPTTTDRVAGGAVRAQLAAGVPEDDIAKMLDHATAWTRNALDVERGKLTRGVNGYAGKPPPGRTTTIRGARRDSKAWAGGTGLQSTPVRARTGARG